MCKLEELNNTKVKLKRYQKTKISLGTCRNNFRHARYVPLFPFVDFNKSICYPVNAGLLFFFLIRSC